MYREFHPGFGDYVEAWNPTAEKKSVNIKMERIEPCIALYPSIKLMDHEKFDLHEITTKENDKPCDDAVEFQSTVAKLLYLANRARPDILLATQHHVQR